MPSDAQQQLTHRPSRNGHQKQTSNSNLPRQGGDASLLASYLSQKKDSMTAEDLPHLITRKLAFSWSHDRVSVTNDRYGSHIGPLLYLDWFHVFLRWPVYWSLPALLSLWTAVILLFALVYVLIDTKNKDLDCGLGPPGIPIAWGTAFAFSLETCTTVGYGLPGSTNAYFEAKCPSVQVAIYAQMTLSMMFNAFMFAFFFLALSRCEKRSYLFTFSEKICIKTVGDKIRLMAQCYDLDSRYPVVEAHARIYVLDKHLNLHPLRIISPNDELSAPLFTSVPSKIIHDIDHYSALSPPAVPPLVVESHGLLMRQADSATAGREEIVCPVCGEAYGTYERLRLHVQYNSVMEADQGIPPEKCHRGFTVPEVTPLRIDEVKEYIKANIAEIIVVGEGIDPQVSGTFQALESYKFEDIVWEGDFAPCFDAQGNGYIVNMQRFHTALTPQDITEAKIESAATTDAADVEQPGLTGSTPSETTKEGR